MQKLSRLGLGTVQFGLPYGVNNSRGQVPYGEVCAILARASEQGITYLDTSRVYGSSEAVLGKAMKEIGKEFIVCSKLDLPPNYRDMTESEIRIAVNDSFEKSHDALDVETISMYLLHIYEYMTTHDGLVWSLVKEIRDRGDIEMAGVSISGGPVEAAASLDDPDVGAIQIPFNVFDQRWRRTGILERCSNSKVVLINRSAYLKGLLVMDPEQASKIVPVSRRYVRRLQSISTEVGIDVKELALRYALGNPRIDVTIVGIDSIEQLEENILLREIGPLESGQIEAIDSQFEDSPDELVNPALWDVR